MAKLYFIYPILFYILYKSLTNKISNINFTKIMILINFFVLTDIFSFILYKYEVFPFYFNFPMNTYGINIQGNIVKEVSIKSMIIISFFIPFNLVINDNLKNINIFKWINYLNTGLNIIVCLFFGRDILTIVLILTIACSLFSWKKLFAIAILIIPFIYYWSDKLYEFIEKVQLKLLSSERFDQVVYLWKGFLSNPIFGKGFGATLGFFLRSEEQPWAYEMTYNYFLFSFGILGTLVIVFYLLLPLILLIKQGNKNTLKRAFCYGYLGFMIANSSNPYFLKFDYINLYFLVLFVILKKENLDLKDSIT